MGTIAATVLLSLATLYWWPQVLYWRAWEYFTEIAFQEADPAVWSWNESEKGDLSREFLFRYQASRPTHVSMDSDGFRSMPCEGSGYQILVQGDSQTWGSGLSDNETIPWRLVEELGRPVFNGGRYPFVLDRVLGNPKLRQAKIVVEVVASHMIEPGIFKDGLREVAWQPYSEFRAPGRLKRINFRRYFLPSHIFRFLEFSNELWRPWHWLKREEEYITSEVYGPEYSADLSPHDLDAVVESIARYAHAVEARGYSYVFAPLPNARFPYTSKRIVTYSDIVRKLQDRGVHAIDMFEDFWQNRHRQLFIRTDTHINPAGADLAARRISSYLRETGLLDSLPEASCVRVGR